MNIADQKKQLEYVLFLLKGLMDDEFTGNIQINFKLGGISNINKLESIRREDFILEVKI